MAEEKNIPGVATEKESDDLLEDIRTQTKEVLKELLAVSRLFFQRNRKLQDRLPFQ